MRIRAERLTQLGIRSSLRFAEQSVAPSKRAGKSKKTRSPESANSRSRSKSLQGRRSSATNALASSPKLPRSATANSAPPTDDLAQAPKARLAENQEKRGASSRKKSTRKIIGATWSSKWTGIPVGRLLEGEGPEARQDGRSFAPSRHRPGERFLEHASPTPFAAIAAGLFVIPIVPSARSFFSAFQLGVGQKTKGLRALAEFLFDDDRAMIRLDMSEYMEKAHRLAHDRRAFPASSLGYEEGGQLTEAIRRKPYSVVLFDEIEKQRSIRDVFNVMLQILEDGQLTDGKGCKVDFRNAVLIMTSNVGSSALLRARSSGSPSAPAKKPSKSLRAAFRPEFLNRIDDIVLFNPLGRDQLRTKIVDLQLASVSRLLADRNVHIGLTPAARALILSASATIQPTARAACFAAPCSAWCRTRWLEIQSSTAAYSPAKPSASTLIKPQGALKFEHVAIARRQRRGEVKQPLRRLPLRARKAELRRCIVTHRPNSIQLGDASG